MTTDVVIQTNDLTKVYNNQTKALDRLTLSVEQGEIFGFLGPNGAGKTTMIRLLLDLIRPTAGTATIWGQDVRENSVSLHRYIGFLPGELNLWKNRTAKQVIHYVASVRGESDAQWREAQKLAERLKFDMSKQIREYSTGNKRKLGLILALMHHPDLLIMDEPTSGLDPLMQQEFNLMMREFKAAGGTVFLSSHVLSEVQAICDRVGILRDGDLKAVEDIEKLTHVEFRVVEMTFRDPVPQAWVNRLQDIDGVSDIQRDGVLLHLKLQGDFDPLLRAVNDGYVQDIQVKQPSLEDIFLAFYGGDDDEGHEQRASASAGAEREMA